MPETITSRDAARFPIVASCTLLGLYLFFKVSEQTVLMCHEHAACLLRAVTVLRSSPQAA